MAVFFVSPCIMNLWKKTLFFVDKVSKYKYIRGGISFVEKIPKSLSGKILRKDLRLMQKQHERKCLCSKYWNIVFFPSFCWCVIYALCIALSIFYCVIYFRHFRLLKIAPKFSNNFPGSILCKMFSEYFIVWRKEWLTIDWNAMFFFALITQVYNFRWISWRLGFEIVFGIILGRWFQNRCQILPMWSSFWAIYYYKFMQF